MYPQQPPFASKDAGWKTVLSRYHYDMLHPKNTNDLYEKYDSNLNTDILSETMKKMSKNTAEIVPSFMLLVTYPLVGITLDQQLRRLIYQTALLPTLTRSWYAFIVRYLGRNLDFIPANALTTILGLRHLVTHSEGLRIFH